MEKNKFNVEYGHDFGRTIYEFVRDSPTVNYTKAGELMGMSRQRFRQKSLLPHFGTIYELIQASIVLDFDFISPAIDILVNENVEVKNTLYSKFTDQAKRIAELEKEVAREKAIIDELLLKQNKNG